MTTILLIVLIALDQISKLLVLSNLVDRGAVEVIPGFFQLLYVENRGAAFGILQDGRTFFIAITVVVIGFLLYALYGKREKLNPTMRTSLILILAGATGNFIDRLRLHYVVDFLSFKVLGHSFAVFNLADAMIVVGTIVLIVQMLLFDEKKHE